MSPIFFLKKGATHKKSILQEKQKVTQFCMRQGFEMQNVATWHGYCWRSVVFFLNTTQDR